MTELKPCPFAKPGEDHHTEIVTAMGESWGLCSCGATGPTFSGIDSERKATEAWNTRAEREVGISKFQKITGTSYIEATSILTSLEQAGVKVVE